MESTQKIVNRQRITDVVRNLLVADFTETFTGSFKDVNALFTDYIDMHSLRHFTQQDGEIPMFLLIEQLERSELIQRGFRKFLISACRLYLFSLEDFYGTSRHHLAYNVLEDKGLTICDKLLNTGKLEVDLQESSITINYMQGKFDAHELGIELVFRASMPFC